MQTIALFSTPLHIEMLDVPSSVHSLLSSQDYTSRPEGFIPYGSVTSDIHLLRQPEFSDVYCLIDNSIQKFIYDELEVSRNIEFQMTTSWGVLNKTGEYTSQHFHNNSLLSFIFYVQVDGGRIIFSKDSFRPNLFLPNVEVEFANNNQYNCKSITIEPQTGMLIVFPSTLHHEVVANESNVNRYAIAGNYFAKGELGSETNRLNLYDIS